MFGQLDQPVRPTSWTSSPPSSHSSQTNLLLAPVPWHYCTGLLLEAGLHSFSSPCPASNMLRGCPAFWLALVLKAKPLQDRRLSKIWTEAKGCEGGGEGCQHRGVSDVNQTVRTWGLSEGEPVTVHYAQHRTFSQHKVSLYADSGGICWKPPQRKIKCTHSKDLRA